MNAWRVLAAASTVHHVWIPAHAGDDTPVETPNVTGIVASAMVLAARGRADAKAIGGGDAFGH